MVLNESFFAGIGFSLILTILIWLAFLRKGEQKSVKLSNAALTCEELEEHARKIAVEHSVSKKARSVQWPLPRLNNNYSEIFSIYKQLNEDVQKKATVPPAAEWLLDNFYIIEEQVKELRRILDKEEYGRLPVLRCGTFKGFARVHALAMEFVAHTDGQMDENNILNYVKAYQAHSALTDRELWAMPALLRLALIENIKSLCERIGETRSQWRKADGMLDELLASDSNEAGGWSRILNTRIKTSEGLNSAFFEHLSYGFRKAGKGYALAIHQLDEMLTLHGTSLEAITMKEHGLQAACAVSTGNSIMSLKFISSLEWEDIFEAASQVEALLLKDPADIYPQMDSSSRNHYRRKVEELAEQMRISEAHIAREAVALAKASVNEKKTENAKAGASLQSHVGFYLIGKGQKILKQKLNAQRNSPGLKDSFSDANSFTAFVTSIVLLSILPALAAASYVVGVKGQRGFLMAVFAAVVVLIPASEIAVSLVNWVVCSVRKPYFFPRLELKEGIPEELAAVVVIPALISDRGRVSELLENLETHYLANREERLSFVLLGDFKDAAEEKTTGDDEIIQAGKSGTEELNRKYAGGGRDRFFFLLRKRSWNPYQKRWMGWERKRGALLEFNDLLLGMGEDRFEYCPPALKDIGRPRYVITLDADTMLPLGMAKKLIGTLAHPLNRPFVDTEKGIVTEGYGILQPRINFDLESSNRSMFSRVFTGQQGMDPYASAISDVYQDFFGEGIFTGKGIYHLETFQRVLKDTIPENSVLSHDLLEGSYIRAGLVSDLELVDSYPAKFSSYASRLHRWVRGDWQLLPWLGTQVLNRKGMLTKNPLTTLSKWKIIDNLRRSLVPPALILLIAGGFSFLPGSYWIWLGAVLLVLGFPLVPGLISSIVSKSPDGVRAKCYTPVMSGMKAAFFQCMLQFVFLPYMAWMMAHAIIVTLYRLGISKTNLLEWVTAADIEKKSQHSVSSYWHKMKGSICMMLLIPLLALMFKRSAVPAGLLLALLWFLTPWIAWRISSEQQKSIQPLAETDRNELRRIARKTWRYFEEFSNFRNHYLPPDNYQEEPPRGIAFRTSPTNIGLGLLTVLTARDFGYVGTGEMLELLTNSINIMEKMEKWNGHLYNWYDTRTLNPLRPRYVSTVDSGNLACYLLTLEQGLREYLDRPVADPVFVNGLEDTLFLDTAGEKNEDIVMLQQAFRVKGEDFTPVLWRRYLDKALSSNSKESSRKKSPWKLKAERMIRIFQRELNDWMPWLDLMEARPLDTAKDHYGGEASREWEAAIELLKSNHKLDQYPRICQEALEHLQTCADAFIKDNTSNVQKEKEWLESLIMAVRKGKEYSEQFIQKYFGLMERILAFSEGMRFSPLYVKKKALFSIGYNVEDNRLTHSYYDLLASEARQTSYLAVARGEVPPKHWFRMGRALTVVDGYKGMVSWTGTMFEYLMPLLLMKSHKNTLLDETYSFALRSQIKYGKQRQIPWGCSESGFYSLDAHMDYQYKAIGVPWLGLKRGLVEDAVTAPYSTFLALLVDPGVAMENIRILKGEGLEGQYGFYEAADYTIERLPFGLQKAVVKSYMAHHQGMSLLAINNCLHGNVFQKRFHANPTIRAAELLLQEKVPANIVITKETKEKVIPFKTEVYKEKGPVRKFRYPDPVLPKVHILSNDGYSVMITDRGTGFSKNRMAAVTRWREENAFKQYGMFFYLRNMQTNAIWSSAYAPLNKLSQKYEAVFTSDKAVFKRTDGNIETMTEIVVASGDSVEVRRLTLKNLADTYCDIEITSYLEVVLAPPAADAAHPAFSNLFVKTEYVADKKCVIASRKPRSEGEEALWMACLPVLEGDKIGELEYETDRMYFIGRGRNEAEPIAMKNGKPLSGSQGPVLDPIISLRVRIRVSPEKTTRISFMNIVAESRDSLMELVDKYSMPETVESAFRLASTRSQVETRYLNLKASEVELCQNMLSHLVFLSPLRRQNAEILEQNRKGQSGLWSYGVSGDWPIVLVVLKKPEDTDLLYDLLKAHEYWRLKGVKVDLVVLGDEENSYNRPLSGLLTDILVSNLTRDLMDKPGGVYFLKNSMPVEDINLFHAVSRLVFHGDRGSMSDQMKLQNLPALPDMRKYPAQVPKYPQIPARKRNLEFFNELGGFNSAEREYVIQLDEGRNTPVPWCNVIANPGFGFLISESGGGYSWYGNSRENKLSPWSNDPVSDLPGEVLYISDRDTGEFWTITPLPVREPDPYIVRHGMGYSVFEHNSHGMEQSLTQFAALDQPIKVEIASFKNHCSFERNIILTWYLRPVAGVSEQYTAMHIRTSADDFGALLVDNPYNEEYAGKTLFMASSENVFSFTGDNREFFGQGDLKAPDALKRQKLSGNTGTGFDPCAALQVQVQLMPGEEKTLVFLLGVGNGVEQRKAILDRYCKPGDALDELKKVKGFWYKQLGAIRVKTPEPSFDLLMNDWLLYQVISCRMWARSAFYQAGGAYGFRDQLQDSMAVAPINPEITKRQILLHASHQFIEGDVQHWWHEPSGKGTRTRFSDDLLWLPFVTAEYIRATGDSEILGTEVPFLQDDPLKEFEDERYSTPTVSEEASSLFNHCIRAIDRSLKFGSHGLPLMGSGDWNDGMNTVGNRGRGESVWLGWFLFDVLEKFVEICIQQGETEKAEIYRGEAVKLRENLNNNAWDGRWYRRAYFDNGMPLGSSVNTECRIDAIAQSWAVISGGGEKNQVTEAMQSLENHLVDREQGLIRLLTPPFDEGDLEPGYIKGYVPGVRENGGQYTHGAAWAVIAFALLGDGDKAVELFNLINPINHTRTPMEYSRYKAEPYVMAADVYAVYPHIGRGGWTWYTGSAGWIYRAGLEYILGFRKKGNELEIHPCIPGKWQEYTLTYRFIDTIYNIKVQNPDGVTGEVKQLTLDGNVLEENRIPLINDGMEHAVEVLLGVNNK